MRLPFSVWASEDRLLSQRRIQQVCQPDPRPLQPVSKEGHMLLEVRGIDHDDLFFLTHRERLIPLLINTLGAGPNAIAHGFAAGDQKRLVGPALDRNRHPYGLVALG